MQENNENVTQLTDIEVFNICLQINSHLIALSSGGKVGDRFQQYEIIKEELQFLSAHYNGQALNQLLEKILQNFNKLEKEVIGDLNKYQSLYGDPNKVGDGYC